MKRNFSLLGMFGLLCLAVPKLPAQTPAADAADNISPELQARIRKLVATLGPDPSRGTCMPQPNSPTNQAKEELIAIGKPATLSLCAVLKEKDDWRRIMATEALIEIRDLRAREPLLHALQFDSSDGVRGEAAEALSNLGDKATVPFLIAALKIRSKDPKKRCPAYAAGKAAEALGKLGDERAIPALLAQIGCRDAFLSYGGSPYSLGEEAAKTLGKLDASAAEPLMQCLRQGNRDVRKDAAKALGIMREKRAVPLLLSLLTSYVNAPESEKSCEDSQANSEIIKALGEIGDKRATLPLLQLADVTTLHDAEYVESFRWQIIEALGKIGDPQVVPTLLSLRSAKYEYLREASLIALARIRTPEVVEPLLYALRQEKENSRIRDAIIEAVGLMKETRALPELQKLLKEYNNIGDKAAVAIGRIDGSLLLSLLHDEDADVRRAVVYGLGETGGEHTVPHLLALLHDETAGTEVLRSLGKLGTPELLPILEPMMREANEDDHWVRCFARGAVIEIKKRYKL